MTREQAEQIYAYLMRTRQAFCFTEKGLVSREDCQRAMRCECGSVLVGAGWCASVRTHGAHLEQSA